MEQQMNRPLLAAVPADNEISLVGYITQFCITDKVFGCAVKVYKAPDDLASVAVFFTHCDLPGILIDEGAVTTHIPGRKGWERVLVQRRIGDQMQYSYPNGRRRPDSIGSMLEWYRIAHEHLQRVRNGLASDRHNIRHQGDLSTYDNGRIRMVWN